ncbi:hypothetical protein D7X98_03955 [bacterium 1XD8-76]|nr:hypothetical protein D7X98_03955 [bacterium 1XD8-76]
MTTPDVNTFLVNFPSPGKEMVVQNEDGSYTVLINAKLSQDGQVEAYEHALKHIDSGDFEKSDVQSIESQAHGLKVPEDFIPAPVNIYEERIKQSKKKRKKIQKALREKEKEAAIMMELYGPELYFRHIESKWLYSEDM